MARSTKIQKIVTDALATRVTAAESGITSIQARNLVDVGDNVSELVNDVQYQTLTQVQAALNNLIDSAPGTLDTLGEIAAALNDDDNAIAALVTQDTAHSTAIAALVTKNASQDTEIANLVADTHDALTLAPQVKGLELTGQELSLKLDPNTDNLLVEATDGLLVDIDLVKNKLNPSLTLAPNNLTLYLDNINGSDLSSDPTISSTPFKTFKQANLWLRKYYFSNNNIGVTYKLISNYQFTVEDAGYFNGESLAISGISIESADADQKILSTSNQSSILFENFPASLNLSKITFANANLVTFQNIALVNILGKTIFNTKLYVKTCLDFGNYEGTVEFNNSVKLDSCDYIVFNIYPPAQQNTLINSEVVVSNSNSIDFSGTFEGNGTLKINSCRNVNMQTINLTQNALQSPGNLNFLIQSFYCDQLSLTGNWNLPSTTLSVINRPLIHASYCSLASDTLTFDSSNSSSFNNQSNDSLFTFVNCLIPSLNFNSDGFSPVFSTSDVAPKLLKLVKTIYLTGTPEATVKTNVYDTPARIIEFDKYSEYLGENILDLRGRITRRTITADLTLTNSDTSRQHIINQSGANRNITLPTNPQPSQEFELINNSTSTFNLVINSVSVIPSDRYAVQWDGVEWVEM